MRCAQSSRSQSRQVTPIGRALSVAAHRHLQRPPASRSSPAAAAAAARRDHGAFLAHATRSEAAAVRKTPGRRGDLAWCACRRRSAAGRRTAPKPREGEAGAGHARQHAAGGVEQDQEGRRKAAAPVGSERREPRHDARRAQHEALATAAATSAIELARRRREPARPARGSPPPAGAQSRSRQMRAASGSRHAGCPRQPVEQVAMAEECAACRAIRNGRSIERHALGDEEPQRMPVVARLLDRHDVRRQDAGVDAESLAQMRASAPAPGRRAGQARRRAPRPPPRSRETRARPPRNRPPRGSCRQPAAAVGRRFRLRAPCDATGPTAAPAPRDRLGRAAPCRARRSAPLPRTRRARPARRPLRRAAGRRRSPSARRPRRRRPRPESSATSTP